MFGNDYPTADGTGVRDHIHVRDLAEGHAAALGFLSQTTGWQAINLGAGKGYSVLEMIQAFEKASGRRVPYKTVSRRTGDVAACYADTQKARKILNWRAVRTLEDMCASTWQFQQPQKLMGLCADNIQMASPLLATGGDRRFLAAAELREIG